MDKEHMMIDGFNFNIASVKAMSLDEFVKQYTDQRQYGTDPDAWQVWLKDAYVMVTGKKEPKQRDATPAPVK